MAYYYVALDSTKSGYTLVGGVKAAVVRADSAATAKAVMGQYYHNVAAWAESTATLIAAPTDYTGWRFRIVVDGVCDVTHTATAQTLDQVGAALVILLNATAINGAAYNTGTNVLTIVETTDNLGDKPIAVQVMAPLAEQPDGGVNFTGFWSTLTAKGAVGIARKVTLLDIARSKVYGVGRFMA